MKSFFSKAYFTLLLYIVMLPSLVLATDTSFTGKDRNAGGGEFQSLIENILVFVNNIIIPFILAIASWCSSGACSSTSLLAVLMMKRKS